MVMLAGASIGWASALCAIVCNGSFGVPIKSETCRRLDIDPLVFQTYKTIMCLLFSFVIVWALGIPMKFSPWGIVSGLFWVPGGVATVLAIKLLGLAVACAVGNSLIALVSFTWGIFIFKEQVHSRPMACLAVLMMISGFSGMSFFSSKDTNKRLGISTTKTGGDSEDFTSHLEEPLLRPSKVVSDARKLDDESSLDGTSSETDSSESDSMPGSQTFSPYNSMESSSLSRSSSRRRRAESYSPIIAIRSRRSASSQSQQQRSSSYLDLPLLEEATSSISSDSSYGRPSFVQISKTSVIVCGQEFSRFEAGLAVATIGGTWGGSVLIPMKFCKEDTSGLGYLISFSCGATIVTMYLWLGRFLYHVSCERSIKDAYYALPSFHLPEMWLYGGISGLLWSTGNLFGILSVHHLGAGVGYCVVQSSMLVGGMWGIFYFGEISGKAMVAKWFLSALVTIAGIILLAYEHGA